MVEELRRKAESEHRERERELRTKLEETENRLEQIEQYSEGTAILSEDQRNEINEFRSEQKRTRKELRSVQHKLIQEIEQLGNALKIINTGLIPLIILSLDYWQELEKHIDRFNHYGTQNYLLHINLSGVFFRMASKRTNKSLDLHN